MTAVLARSVGYTNFPLNPYYQTGKELVTVGFRKTFPTTGNAGDQYILAGPLSLDDRVARIYPSVFATLTGATSCNLGFYKSTDNGATLAGLTPVVPGGGNELFSAVDLHTAPALGQDMLAGKNSSLDLTKSIRDLLNIGPDQSPVGGIFLVLTLTNANSAGGMVDLDIDIEEATTR